MKQKPVERLGASLERGWSIAAGRGWVRTQSPESRLGRETGWEGVGEQG